MELKNFVSNVITDVVAAIEESSDKLSREIYLDANDKERTIEFDVAVTAENITAGEGKSGVRVLELVEVGGKVSKENKNTTVSRIKFGVHINKKTKEQEQNDRRELDAINEQNIASLNIYD